MNRRSFIKTGAASVGALALSASGCSKPRKSSPPNIVLIVMDTVRRDHLSCYGYERDTSPFLTSLLGESRKYTNAYSTSSWTFPSHASIFTGLYPVSHGARWGNVFVDPDLTTLPDILKANGYQTIGVAENGLIGEGYGYDHGWDSLVNPGLIVEDDTTAGTRVARELLSQSEGRPFFFFLNLLAAHQPYSTGGPFQNTFLSDPAFESAIMPLFLSQVAEGEPLPGAKFRTHLTEHYDAEIRFVDSLVEQIVTQLKTMGVWDDTLFIVTADHGEGLGEHDHYDHQFYLYENLVQIPLMIRWPQEIRGNEIRDDYVSLVDIFPSVLSAAGLDSGRYPSQARNLFAGVPGDSTPIITEYYLHQAFRDTVKRGVIIPVGPQAQFSSPRLRERFAHGMRAIRQGDIKLIKRDDGAKELYNLAVDPEELVNLAAEAPYAATVRNLEAALEERLDLFRRMRDGETGGRDLSKDAIEQLKALGYL